MMIQRVGTGRGGFSLLELLTAMIVISILGLVAIPNFKRAVHKADARKVLTDMTAVRAAVYEYREDEGRLPPTARWGTVPPTLEPYLNNVDFQYKSVEYRIRSNRRRGRVDFFVRYPRNDEIGLSLQTFSRPGRDEGSVTWNRRRTRFRLLEGSR